MKAAIIARLAALAALLAACGGSNQAADTPGQEGEVTRRDTTIVHEACDLEADGAVSQDANRDGRPDVVSVVEGGKKLCQWLDFNFDGVVDAWVYYSADGQVRRRETDFDRDGRVDEISTFEGGQLKSRQRATTLAGRLDTWQYFEGGALKRAERDSDGNAIIDQWWEYPHANRIECPVVHTDVDGDGRPDPGATVDLCEEEGAISEASAEAPATGPTPPLASTAGPATSASEPPPHSSAADTPSEAAPPSGAQRADSVPTGSDTNVTGGN